ncbi:translocation/assembly module TamB domain-containing protein [Variovorax fucosicus]|uniref:translocation/assembly module TamB domain-containing protein n=1 Tax=Variovorax fucosicus TaxID=3053517 RepID=UPI0025757A88|nr:translocation/assembly module TamB domain-containing protein [Variovorax sp. J22G47]MDM0054329.1 translocation/assembly module TamB domain-containing protein [Variovorax sp. J22G47]
MQSEAPDATSSLPATLRRSRARRALRAAAWTFGCMLALLAVLVATGWWWIGSNQSLAFTLARAARYLPADQSLESREVSGSVRNGGRIGFLRWQSPTLAVEVHQATIGWSLRPLLSRQFKLGEVHAVLVTAERRGPPDDKPVEPLEQLALPIDIDLPFRIDTLRWSGPPPLQADQLAGHYRYAGAQHALQLDGVDIAEGHYSGKLTLQGPAPMAIEAALDGRVRAPLDPTRNIDVLASASIRGTLAGRDARLAIAADLKPATQDEARPMQAQLVANLAPWLPQPVIDAKADLQNVDLERLWPEAPSTLLSGELVAGPDAAAGPNGWQGTVNIRNAEPGPWDRGKLPVEQVEAKASFDGSRWTIPQATVRAGRGRIDAEGRWSPAPEPWQIKATVQDVRPGELHTQLAGARIDGRLSAEQRGEALLFDLALNADGGAGAAGALQGLRLDRAVAQGQWQDQVLDLRTLRIDALRTHIDGRLQLRVAEQAGSGKLQMTLPGGSAEIDGRIAPAQGAGELKAQVDDAAMLQKWIEQLPGLANAFAGTTVTGNAKLDARWQGGWQAVQRRLQNIEQPAATRAAEPTLQATLAAPRLDLKLPPPATGPATAVQLRGLHAELAGSLAQATLSLQGEAGSGTRKFTLDTRASGGLVRANQWQAALASLKLQAQDSTLPGPWTMELGRPVSATIRTGSDKLDIEATAGSATLRGPAPGTVRLDWQPVRFSQSGAAPNRATRAYRLQSQGKLQGLPMAWAEALGGNSALAELGVSGDLLFDGDWDIDAGDTLRARARLARQSGDIRVQAGEAALIRRLRSTGTGTASEITTDSAGAGPSTPAGLRRAEVSLDAQGDTVKAQLAWDSERAGQINAEASTRVQQRAGGWQWAEDAPLAGKVTARLPNLGVWSMLAPPGWRIAGTLDADATLSGNRAAPRWNGMLGADKLALRAQVEGLDLRDGRLRANLTGDRLELTEFTLRGGPGSSTRIPGQGGNRSTAASEAASDGGTLSARGTVSWGAATPSASGIRMAMQAQLRSLRLLVRTDRQVTVSGDLQARLETGQITVRGDLKTDRAVIILPDETAPSLGSDVVVRSAAKDREAAEAAKVAQQKAAREEARPAAAQTAKPPDIAVNFDLGNDFAVQGRGITTRLEGKLDIRSAGMGTPPRITGEVKTVKGQYRAYGQQMDVETGIARFNGPFDNPALDILAIRPNITQRAGVQITGTAQSPRVRLYSEPTLSDAETLSWVVLGRASASSGGEAMLMQQAALALLSGIGKGGSGGGIANRFGLDEIGFKGPGSSGDLKGSAITLGKRLSQDFYVTYERSLAGTLGTLYIFYDLTKRLTLRGQAGVQSGVDLIYTVQYD